jgi:VanZ like protein
VKARQACVCAAGLLFLGDLRLHLPITDMCDALVRRFGFPAFDRGVRAGFVFAGLGIAAAALAWHTPRKSRKLAALGALAAAALIAHRVLLVSAIENIHYPQYALLAVLFAAGGLRRDSSWLIATALGALDEWYQHVVLPRGTPGYFDWNDVVLNAVGAAFGVVLLAIFRDNGRERPASADSWSARTAPLAALVVILTAWPGSASPFYTTTEGGRMYHRLGAIEAIGIVALVWSVVAGFSRTAHPRLRASAGRPPRAARPSITSQC